MSNTKKFDESKFNSFKLTHIKYGKIYIPKDEKDIKINELQSTAVHIYLHM